MVTLYVAGQKVDWADAGRALAELSALGREVELRNDAGKVIARLVPEPTTSAADDPDWVKAITPDAIKRAMEGPFFTLEEWCKQAGWE